MLTKESLEQLLATRKERVLAAVQKVQAGGCPPPGQLIALRRGRLVDNERTAVEAHVVFCDRCSGEYLALESLDQRGDEAELRAELGRVKVSLQTRQAIHQL